MRASMDRPGHARLANLVQEMMCKILESLSITPAVQFLTVLRAFSITATDGETRQLHAGEVLRLEDTSPCKGHITVAGDQPGS